MYLWYLYVYVTPFPNGYVLFQPFIQSLNVDLYLALLNLYLRDPSLERKASFFLKVVFAVTFGIYLCNLGTFWVLTKCNQHGSKFRQLGGTQTLPTCQRHYESSSAFVNHSAFDGHVKTFYENQERHIVRQARLKSRSFKFDDRGRIIIMNTKRRKQSFP